MSITDLRPTDNVLAIYIVKTSPECNYSITMYIASYVTHKTFIVVTVANAIYYEIATNYKT